MNKIDASELGGVSETALLTLNGRAYQAGLPDAILHDPMAIELVGKIDFDFDKFGRKGQEMALRSLAVDRCALDYLGWHPKATVVALAEGFQTSFWRLDAAIGGGEFRWLTVDLPPVVELRTRLLPDSPRIAMCAQSALDYSWMDRVDAAGGVFITAEGLLMHLPPEDSLGLIAECARRFPGAQMLFDLTPAWAVRVSRRRGMRISRNYRTPPLLFGASAARLATLLAAIPGVRAVHNLPDERMRGRLPNLAASLAYRLPFGDRLRNILTLVEFDRPLGQYRQGGKAEQPPAE